MSKHYMEKLLDAVAIVKENELYFSRAKIKSQEIADSLVGESFAVILTALYLMVMAVIDAMDIDHSCNQYFN